MYLFLNNARATLAAAIAAPEFSGQQMEITLDADGSQHRFPGVVYHQHGEVLLATLTHPSAPGQYEIISVRARSGTYGEVMTVQRQVEGQVGRAWPAGTSVECRITADMLNSFPQVERGAPRQITGRTQLFNLGNLGGTLYSSDGDYGDTEIDDGLMEGDVHPVGLRKYTNYTGTAFFLTEVGFVLCKSVTDGEVPSVSMATGVANTLYSGPLSGLVDPGDMLRVPVSAGGLKVQDGGDDLRVWINQSVDGHFSGYFYWIGMLLDLPDVIPDDEEEEPVAG